MQRSSLPASPRVHVRGPSKQPIAPSPRLSIVHADALYRLIPPVEFDDEGYPYRDGKLPESTKHGRTLNYGLAAAGVLLNHLPDALVAYDLLFLFEEGNPRAAVAPDLMVALGAGRHDRNSYKLWEEGRPPDFALEALSQRTWQKDVQIKPGLYRDLGVREFWQLDPLRKLPEPMIGYRLDAGVYKPIPVEQSGGRRSEVLGAELFFDGTELRIRSLRTGKDVPHLPQAMQRLDQSERQREEERARRQTAERQREEERAGRQTAERQREEERARRQTAERQRDQAEQRLAELEAELRR